MLEGLIGDIVIKVIAVLVGIATGAVQFYLLFKFVTSVTGGKAGIKTLLFALTQFLFPFAILVICAFLLPASLMWVGIGIAASLITCAIVRFIKVSRQKDVPIKKDVQMKKDVSKKKDVQKKSVQKKKRKK